MNASGADEVNRQIHERQKELLTHAYSQATAYTNLIMIGGYAGFFGLWSLTKEHLMPGQVYWSALFVSISILVFVFFEVFKMVVNGKILQGVQQAVDTPTRFVELINAHKEKAGKTMRWFGKIWVGVLIVAVGTGLAGGGIMVYSFICGLNRLYAGG